MDIEVNEYVRTKDGYIAKCIEIDTDFSVCGFDNTIRKNYGDRFDFLYLEDIAKCVVKHSKQLIDLIENKDILKVRTDKTIMFFGIDEGTSDIKYKEIIKSIENGECELLEILTHQQFESNCYKVGEEEDE